MSMNKRVALVSSLAVAFPNFRRGLIERLLREGYEVFALAPDFTPDTRYRVEALGAHPIDIYLQRSGTNPVHDARSVINIARTIARLHPNAVVLSFVKPVIYGGIAAWLVRVPVRISLIEGLGSVFIGDSAGNELRRSLVQGLYRIALRVATKVVFLNPDDLNLFVSRRLVKQSKTIMLGGIGVELSDYNYSSSPEGPPSFVFVGRLLKDKGLIEFAQATRFLKAKHPNIRVTIVGSTDSNPTSLSLKEVRQWVKEGLFNWVGQVDDVRPFLRGHSVFVLPSYREGLPRSTMEAMAIGRPIITTDVPGCNLTVVDGINGKLVSAMDPYGLYVAMRWFVHNESEIQRMGQESRLMAETLFDARSKIDILVDLLPSTSV